MRRDVLLGGVCLLGITAALVLYEAVYKDPTASPIASLANVPVDNELAMRNLGFRLLAGLPEEEMRAGLSSLQNAAERGSVEAQISLGRLYLNGAPQLSKEPSKAREWFLRAETKAHPSAAYFLGIMSQNGDSEKADPIEAARWFEIAAKRGSSDAMFLLSNAYRAGQGVAKDEKMSLEFLKEAAEKGHPASLQALAMAYRYGELGVEPDEAEARRYMMEAEHSLHHRFPSP